MLLGLSGETRRRYLQRIIIAVGDECRTGGQNARCDTGGQGLKVGIHNRVLDRVEREIQLVCRTRLRAGEHQTVSGPRGANGAVDGKGGNPDPVSQLWRWRVEVVIRMGQ